VKLLIDTHTLIWVQDETAKLGKAAVVAMEDPESELIVSAATIWEIGIKIALGKLKLSPDCRTWIENSIAVLNLTVLPIRTQYVERQIALPFHHRGPFDRMIAAQSLVDAIPVVSADTLFDAYGVSRIWN
jgi:PIN domain nuclease of toxin-antitoxin system